MAAAEARVVWQRTAKLASISSVISRIDSKLVNSTDCDNFPLPNEKSFYSNLEPDSKWWIQLQHDYMYQRSLTNEQVNSLDPRNPHQFVENQVNSSVCSVNSLSSKESYEFVQIDSVDLPWWQKTEKSDLNGPMHSGLGLQKVKCGQKAISGDESRLDTSKTKILEALCHSQTRAREAEIAAKKAYAEKEHAIKVVFRQASQLFAYRQWIYVLQLENLCYQNKNKNDKSDQEVSNCAFPSAKIGKLDKNTKKAVPAKGKRRRTKRAFGRSGHDLGKYAVVFVVGLGIVGAGLVLGWTVGWMLI